MKKSHSPNDHRSINLDRNNPGGGKNLAHNQQQGPAKGGQAPAAIATPATPSAPPRGGAKPK